MFLKELGITSLSALVAIILSLASLITSTALVLTLRQSLIGLRKLEQSTKQLLVRSSIQLK